jgi:hypothetical protein
MSEGIVKARDLKAGDVVLMPVGRRGPVQVEITEAQPGQTYGNVPCIHVHGVDAQGAVVNVDFSPESTFRWLRLAYGDEDE